MADFALYERTKTNERLTINLDHVTRILDVVPVKNDEASIEFQAIVPGTEDYVTLMTWYFNSTKSSSAEEYRNYMIQGLANGDRRFYQ